MLKNGVDTQVKKLLKLHLINKLCANQITQNSLLPNLN
jgi:hypothetical protein